MIFIKVLETETFLNASFIFIIYKIPRYYKFFKSSSLTININKLRIHMNDTLLNIQDTWINSQIFNYFNVKDAYDKNFNLSVKGTHVIGNIAKAIV